MQNSETLSQACCPRQRHVRAHEGLQGGIEAPGVGNLFIRIRSSIGSQDILPTIGRAQTLFVQHADVAEANSVQSCAEIHALEP
jgi:hypothetical protein